MKTFKQYFLKLIFITVCMLILSAPLLWLQIYCPNQIHSMSSFIKGHFWALTVFRLLLIVGFFVTWKPLVLHFSRKYQWEKIKTQFWLAKKFRITIWLIIFELLICQNFLFYLLA